MAAGSTPCDEMIVTTPLHFSTGSRSRGSKRAKQYPGNSGQSIFFLRSFQRLQRVTVGRNVSMCLCSNCSHTTCSCRDRVHTAYHCRSPSMAGVIWSASLSAAGDGCTKMLIERENEPAQAEGAG